MIVNELPFGCGLIDVPLVTDQRGTLVFATVGEEIPFPVARVFWIYDVPTHQRRGGHAHTTCNEVIFAVRGAVTMLVDNGTCRTKLRLDSPTRGLLVSAGVWCELCDFAPDTVLVVLASHAYDATGYIHDYEQFLQRSKE